MWKSETFCSSLSLRRNLTQNVLEALNQPASAQFNGTIRSSAVVRSGHPSYLKAKINGNDCECLLDSGSEVTVLPHSLVKKCRLTPTTQTLKAANGSSIPIPGEAKATFLTSKFKSKVTNLVTEHIVEAMLGINQLYDNGTKCRGLKDSSITFEGQRHNLIARTNTRKFCSRVVLEQDVEVPPRAQVDLPYRVIFSERELAILTHVHVPYMSSSVRLSVCRL